MIRRIAHPAAPLLIVGMLAAPCRAQIPPAPPPVTAPPVHVPRGPRLQPNLIPPMPRRPFEWGRSPGYHKRFGTNACGVPGEYVGRYERQVPVVVASSTTFFPPILDTITLRTQPFGSPGGITPGFPATTTAASAMTMPIGQTPAPPATMIVRRKRFRFEDDQLALGPFLMPTPGVTVYDNGELRATALVSHDGGLAGADRGAMVLVRLRAFAGQAADPLAPGAAVLWSTEARAWIPRGGPTEVPLIPGPEVAAEIARGFDEATHLQVTIEPLTIR